MSDPLEERIRQEIPAGFYFAMRPAGAYRHLATPAVQANQLLVEVELAPLDLDRFSLIDLASARRLLTRILHRSLAFTSIELRSRAEAERIAAAFLGAFGPPTTFLCNAEIGEDGEIGSWDSASLLTFDAGVVAIGGERVGILWAAEDD
ncbi:MAG: hypothetical protein U0166_18670 [Acidobacteriota bacterium]